MKKNYSEDDLLNYIYKESSPNESKLIENAILESDELKSLYLELIECINLLNKTSLRPSEMALENILNIAREGIQQKVD